MNHKWKCVPRLLLVSCFVSNIRAKRGFSCLRRPRGYVTKNAPPKLFLARNVNYQATPFPNSKVGTVVCFPGGKLTPSLSEFVKRNETRGHL